MLPLFLKREWIGKVLFCFEVSLRNEIIGVFSYFPLVCTEEMLTPTDLSVMSVDSPSFPTTDLPNLFTSVGVVSNTLTTTAEIVVTFNTASPPRVTTVTTTVTKATSVEFTLLDEDDTQIQTQVCFSKIGTHIIKKKFLNFF